MKITDIRITPVNQDKLKAYVSIVFDNCFLVKDIKVIQGPERLFLSMPSRRLPDGTFKDIAHPINQETRRMLETFILERYREVSAQAHPPVEGPELGSPEDADDSPLPGADGD